MSVEGPMVRVLGSVEVGERLLSGDIMPNVLAMLALSPSQQATPEALRTLWRRRAPEDNAIEKMISKIRDYGLVI